MIDIKYLYRFMDFETFLEMIQSKSLTFVLPSLWDDPYEFEPFYTFFEQSLKKSENPILAAMQFTIKRKTYAQCWTSLPESDALWRIYDKKKNGIRLRVKTEKIEQLENITTKKVKYYSNLHNIDYLQYDNRNFDQIFCIKRKAFSHEKEVRLLDRFCFPLNDDEEIKKHIQAFFLANGENFRTKYMAENNISSNDFETILEQLLVDTGYLGLPETKRISFSHIPQFIDSIMLSPFSSDWFESTVLDYCQIHNLRFLGKSQLYTYKSK